MVDSCAHALHYRFSVDELGFRVKVKFLVCWFSTGDEECEEEWVAEEGFRLAER